MTIEVVCEGEEGGPRLYNLSDGVDRLVFQGDTAPIMFYGTARAKGVTPEGYSGEYGSGFTFASADARYILIPEYETGAPCLIVFYLSEEL